MASRWVLPGLSGALLLVALGAPGLGIYQRAAGLLERELDRRLLAAGTLAARDLESAAADGADVGRRLDRLRGELELENAFVVAFDGTSLADARTSVPRGHRYTLLELDPDLLAAGLTGRAALSPRYEVAGIALRAVCVPMPGRRALVLETSPAFAGPLRELRVLGRLGAALAVAAAVGFGLLLWAVRRRLERDAAAALRVERLALAGRLAAQVSHEIRNPLAILRGATQLAQSAARAGRNPLPHLADLLEEVDRIDALVGDFLSLSREMALQVGPLDVESVLARAASLAEVGLRRPVERRPSPGLPAVRADERRLRQVLLGLLMNASESGAQRIALGASVRDGWVVVEVEDDGPGMDAATRRRALEPFFTTKREGTGLGLTVAQRILEAHGGRLELDSAPGRGTRVRLYLSVQGTARDVPIGAEDGRGEDSGPPEGAATARDRGTGAA